MKVKKSLCNGKEVSQIPPKKLGRPLTLRVLYSKVQLYLRSSRAAGTPINARIVIAAAEGIVKATDSTLFHQNGGHILLGFPWEYSIWKGWVMYSKRLLLSPRHLALRWSLRKPKIKAYQQKIKMALVGSNAPPKLITNFNESGVNVLSSSRWAQVEKGSKWVEISGFDDKCQITFTMAGTLSEKFLSLQVLYAGKTKSCHPSSFPNGFDVWHMPNHWANSDTCVRYLEKVILPYMSLQNVKNFNYQKSTQL